MNRCKINVNLNQQFFISSKDKIKLEIFPNEKKTTILDKQIPKDLHGKQRSTLSIDGHDLTQ